MNIRFNIEKSQRKALAQKIGELAEMDVRYCGVPSCAYEIGFFTLSKDAVLSFADRMDTEIIERVLDGLNKAGYTSEDEPEALTISIAHNGHPVLRWNMDNIFIKRDPAGNIKPDKEKSTEKIDGTVATIMALDRAIRCGNDTGDSIYDERDLLVL